MRNLSLLKSVGMQPSLLKTEHIGGKPAIHLICNFFPFCRRIPFAQKEQYSTRANRDCTSVPLFPNWDSSALVSTYSICDPAPCSPWHTSSSQFFRQHTAVSHKNRVRGKNFACMTAEYVLERKGKAKSVVPMVGKGERNFLRPGLRKLC